MHKFECLECGVFCPDEDYDDDPKTRVCPTCGEGSILYHGYTGPLAYVQRDSIGEGVKGIVNPVNGKRYDSKSSYEKDIKASGHVIMGNDAPKEPNREIRGDFSGLKQDISKAVDQVFSNQPKGKKRK